MDLDQIKEVLEPEIKRISEQSRREGSAQFAAKVLLACAHDAVPDRQTMVRLLISEVKDSLTYRHCAETRRIVDLAEQQLDEES
jgi:hypothetical protein